MDYIRAGSPRAHHCNSSWDPYLVSAAANDERFDYDGLDGLKTDRLSKMTITTSERRHLVDNEHGALAFLTSCAESLVLTSLYKPAFAAF